MRGVTGGDKALSWNCKNRFVSWKGKLVHDRKVRSSGVAGLKERSQPMGLERQLRALCCSRRTPVRVPAPTFVAPVAGGPTSSSDVCGDFMCGAQGAL